MLERSIAVDKRALEYSQPRTPTAEIEIKRFEDGGVTITIPRYSSGKSHTAAKVVGAVVGCLAFFWVDVARSIYGNMPLWPLIKADLHRLGFFSVLLATEPVLMAIVLVFLVILWLRYATAQARSLPTVIAIDRKVVYVNRPSWLGRRKIELSRKRLEKIQLGRYYGDRGFLSPGQFIELHFLDRIPVSVFVGRPSKDLKVIADALTAAAAATSDHGPTA